MKIFLSGLEAETRHIFEHLKEKGEQLPFGLMSYYYVQKNPDIYKIVCESTKEILIDSGAHSFQNGKKVNWKEYTEAYAKWIQQVDNDKIIGYFEMDVDNIIGYEAVLDLRKTLDAVTDKIIPVWHKNRGVDEFKRMCKETKGDIVAITGFRNEDIRDEQYPIFLKYAWKCGKKIHCLGMTRIKILDKVPFDYVDSSSWKQSGVYGTVKKFENGKLKTLNVKGFYKTKELSEINFKEYLKLVDYYHKKWAKINNDLYIVVRFAISRIKKLGGKFHVFKNETFNDNGNYRGSLCDYYSRIGCLFFWCYTNTSW